MWSQETVKPIFYAELSHPTILPVKPLLDLVWQYWYPIGQRVMVSVMGNTDSSLCCSYKIIDLSCSDQEHLTGVISINSVICPDQIIGMNNGSVYAAYGFGRLARVVGQSITFNLDLHLYPTLYSGKGSRIYSIHDGRASGRSATRLTGIEYYLDTAAAIQGEWLLPTSVTSVSSLNKIEFMVQHAPGNDLVHVVIPGKREIWTYHPDKKEKKKNIHHPEWTMSLMPRSFTGKQIYMMLRYRQNVCIVKRDDEFTMFFVDQTVAKIIRFNDRKATEDSKEDECDYTLVRQLEGVSSVSVQSTWIAGEFHFVSQQTLIDTDTCSIMLDLKTVLDVGSPVGYQLFTVY